MGNQIQIAIDPETDNLIIAFGPQAHVTMAPRDALGLITGLATILAQHPYVQPKPASKIVVANCLPRIAGGIDLQ